MRYYSIPSTIKPSCIDSVYSQSTMVQLAKTCVYPFYGMKRFVGLSELIQKGVAGCYDICYMQVIAKTTAVINKSKH
uniref:Uncharacterized protein n=1 Tax=Hyaloperonospora arabidopsidis (strain Emoy2) TaxID=559515 RepID=M4B2U9_HYAAE